jgi:hypothetical protein
LGGGGWLFLPLFSLFKTACDLFIQAMELAHENIR